MKRISFLMAVLLAAPAISACDPEAPKNDPVRTKFIAGCDGLKPYQSMKPEKRIARCKCIYDKTLRGLTDEEKRYARFYLLVQAGLEAEARKLLSMPNMDAIVKSSNAIGAAVKQCG